MRSRTAVPAVKYKFENACSLFNEDCHIDSRFAKVLDALDEYEDIEVKSTGCGGCFVSEAPAAVFFVAQNDDIDDTMALKYDINDFDLTRKGLGYLIYSKALELGVPVSWNEDESMSVVLGTDDYFANLDVGTQVEYRGMTGEVISDDELDYSLNDGSCLVKFSDDDKRIIPTRNLETL